MLQLFVKSFIVYVLLIIVVSSTTILAFSLSNRCSMKNQSYQPSSAPKEISPHSTTVVVPSSSSSSLTATNKRGAVSTSSSGISSTWWRQNARSAADNKNNNSNSILMAVPTSTSTRSRPGKRASSIRRPPARTGSSDSLAGTSLSSSHALELDEFTNHNTNTNGQNAGNNNINSHDDAAAAVITTQESMGSTSTGAGTWGRNKNGSINHSQHSTDDGGSGGDIEAPPTGRISRSSLVPMEIRTSPETVGGASDEDTATNVLMRKTRSIIPRRLLSFSAKQPSWIAMLDNPSLQTGRLLVLGASAIYGTNFATVKLLDDSMPLSVSAALRFGLASAVVSAFVLSRESDDVDGRVEKERNLAFWSGAEVGLWYSIAYLAQAEGLQTVAAGKSAFFNSLAVVVVPLLDALVKGKILQKKEIASVALACFGVGLLEVGPAGLQITPGDILAFMQTIFFGIGYWRLESVSHAHPHQAARVTVGQLTAVAGGAALYALTEFGLGHMNCSIDLLVEWLGDPFILGALVWTGLISTALALYLETVALKVVSATELTLLMTTTSLWGASFAYVTIGEVLSPTGMLGGLMILVGCGLSAAVPAAKEKAQTPSTDRIATL